MRNTANRKPRAAGLITLASHIWFWRKWEMQYLGTRITMPSALFAGWDDAEMAALLGGR